MGTIHNIRLAFRLLRRSPSTTAIALISIALSVAATAVVFVAIKSVLIAPLPYSHADRLVQIRTEFGNKFAKPSIVDFGFWNGEQEIARRSRTLESVAAYGNVIFDLAGDSSTPTVLQHELPATNRDRTLRLGLMRDRMLGGPRNLSGCC